MDFGERPWFIHPNEGMKQAIDAWLAEDENMSDEKNEPKIEWANPEAYARAMDARSKKEKPDWTLTGARVVRAFPGGFTVAWETQSAGFGELEVRADLADGRLHFDTERLGYTFAFDVIEYLCARAICDGAPINPSAA